MNLLEGRLQVQTVETVARETVKIIFSLQNAQDLKTKEPLNASHLTFQAGQFLSLQFSQTAWRAYSIASAPQEKNIELVIRLVPGGVASEIFRTTKEGDLFPFKGPFGGFVLSQNPEAHLVFCGTGTGIAPLRSMILTENKSPQKRPMTLLYGGRDKNDIAYLDEISSWSQDLKIHIGLSREKEEKNLKAPFRSGRITQFLEEMTITPHYEFYICGNGDMVKSMQEWIREKTQNQCALYTERFN